MTAKGSAHDPPQVKADAQSAYDAANPEVAKLVADAVVKKGQPASPAARASFLDGFEARVAYLRCPPAHHKYIRPTNLAERAIEEERRRTKTIPTSSRRRAGRKAAEALLRRADAGQ